jgi:uncharacterized YigZ family protein
MKSIKEVIITEDIINKSKFINYLIPVSDLEDTKTKLDDIRKQYSDASHHCFAYIVGNNQEIQKYSDDGEPSKTAGLPILEVLKKHDLTNVLSVTIRYYGGTKLGAGGLTRAYTKSVAESVALATFTSLTNYTHLSIKISFDHIGHVEKYIRDHYELLDTTYDNFVNYTINIKSNESEEFQNSVTEFTKGSAEFTSIKTYDIYK